MRILITGAAGFIGSHITEVFTIMREPWDVVAMDCLTYAGRLDRLNHLDTRRIQYVHHDFSLPFSDSLLKAIGPIDYIIHNGAASHVSRSFMEPRTFINSNAIGTLNVLEAARKLQPKKIIYVSTDEVFGSTQLPHKEDDKLSPTNPYAASKAAGELLSYSYFRSFGLPVVITHTMNVFGERQHPEKFIPMTIRKILRGEPVLIHGEEKESRWSYGTRNWVHARSQAHALEFLLRKGNPGEKYNIAGVEKSNLDIFHLISDTLGLLCQWAPAKSPYPVHDLHYALDGSKMESIGWDNPISFEPSFRKMVLWTAQNPQWLEE